MLADTNVSDLEVDQAKAETDLEPVRQRLARNRQRIGDGSIVDPKALNSLVEEVEHLKRRIGDLEDAELELMEALESATAERDRLRSQARELDGEIEATTAKRQQQLAELDADVAHQQRARAGLVPEVPADLLALYVKIGDTHNGVGAAELRQRRCTGCQLEINAADLRGFVAAPPEEVLRCEECSRILVRTAQSGL